MFLHSLLLLWFYVLRELVLHHYPLWVSWLQSSVEMIWMPLSSLKRALFDECFTSELHIMEEKPWGHNLNTPAPQLTRKKVKKWVWLAAEESTLPILKFAQHHPDKFKKKKKSIQSFPAVGKTLFKCLQGNPNLNDKLLPADWLEDLLQIRQAAL